MNRDERFEEIHDAVSHGALELGAAEPKELEADMLFLCEEVRHFKELARLWEVACFDFRARVLPKIGDEEPTPETYIKVLDFVQQSHPVRIVAVEPVHKDKDIVVDGKAYDASKGFSMGAIVPAPKCLRCGCRAPFKSIMCAQTGCDYGEKPSRYIKGVKYDQIIIDEPTKFNLDLKDELMAQSPGWKKDGD